MDRLFEALAPFARQDTVQPVVHIDLQQVTFISASGLAWLCAMLCGLQCAGTKTALIPPHSEGVCQWLGTMLFWDFAREHNFAVLEAAGSPLPIGAGSVSPSAIQAGAWEPAASHVLLPLTSVAGNMDIRAITIRILDEIAGILAAHLGYDERDIANISTALTEACQNICDHSGGEGVVAVQRYTTQKGQPFVDIGVADAGCGIRQSLMATNLDAIGWSHHTAIFKALQRGVSGRADEDRGLGLPRIQQIVEKYQGRLHIRSGDVRLAFTDTVEGAKSGLFPGTQLSLSLSTRSSL